jgi:hypothetical protein
MPLIDFPSNVPLNYEFISGSNTWVWDGKTWNAKTSNLLYNYKDIKNGFSYFNDFIDFPSSVGTRLTLNRIGIGTVNILSSSTNHAGISEINGNGSATVSTRSSVITSMQTNLLTLNHGIGNSFCESLISIPVLSVITGATGAKFIVTSGFSNCSGASATYTSQTTGVYFAYDINGTITGTPSTYWQAVVQNSGSITSTVTSVLVNINTWYKLAVNTFSTTTSGTPGDISCSSSNTINFYINDTLVASPTTTNFPTGIATTAPQIACHQVSSSSATTYPSKVNADYLYFGQNFNEVLYR